MSKYELSLSPDYVPSWTVVDAVRELFQNAVDQQATVEGNEMYWKYLPGISEISLVGQLRIGNKLSVLSSRSLLLGASTKVGDINTIGQFGEGYKVACLVLLRNGKKVTFYNYGAKEVWTPRFKKSRKYGTDILEFDINTKFPWSKVPDNNLTIVIDGITPDEWTAIVESNLHLQEDVESIEVSQGRILTDIKHASKVFVNGLYVCEHKAYVKGYDFKPKLLRLDRDRKLASSFDLEWLSSKMYVDQDNEQMLALADTLLSVDAADVKYIQHNISAFAPVSKKLAERSYETFTNTHGHNAVPVATQSDMERVPTGYKPVLVSENRKAVIEAAGTYEAPPPSECRYLKDTIQEWLSQHRQSLSKKAIKQMELIIEGIDPNVKL